MMRRSDAFIRLLAAEFLGNLDNVLCTQAKLLQQLCCGAGVTELVVNTDTLDRSGLLLSQDSRNRFAQAA